MSEITWIIDQSTGQTFIEGLTPEDAPDLLGEFFAPGREMGCARPLAVLLPPDGPLVQEDGDVGVRIAGYYHNSLVEGPGRRSSVLLSGCDLKCPGCWVPSLHPAEAGRLVPARQLATLLLDPAYQRDGVSILGGEPFQQLRGLLALMRALRARRCPHILCYSGYTFETLRRRATREPEIGAVLDSIDVLVDGPFVQALADAGGPWTGSGNQRVIDLVATRQAGRVVLLDVLG